MNNDKQNKQIMFIMYILANSIQLKTMFSLQMVTLNPLSHEQNLIGKVYAYLQTKFMSISSSTPV